MYKMSMKRGPIAKGKAVQCLTLGRWLIPYLTTDFPSDLVQGTSFSWQGSGEVLLWLMVFRAPQQLVPCKCDGSGGYQNLAFGLCAKLQVLPTPVCSLLCVHGRCADYKDYSSLYNTKAGALNWMKTAPCEHHSYNIAVMCMIHAPLGTPEPWAAVSQGWEMSALGQCDQGYRFLPVPNKSAPAESGSAEGD